MILDGHDRGGERRILWFRDIPTLGNIVYGSRVNDDSMRLA